MKQFRIDVSHASPGQILTIAAELKIMSNNWERFGPRIMINGQKLQAPSLHESRTKRQASSSKRHNIARFI
jgi:phenylacetate-coenzyme A ligase PaaK-like adenylate-forming protein